MTLNRSKNSNFFPSKVYRCPCLMGIIDFCRENDINSFVEIHDEVWDFVLNDGEIDKVFSVKCGENLKDCIFVCKKHLSIIIFGKKRYNCTDEPSFDNITVYYNEDKKTCNGKTFCKGCIKNFLRKSICYFYFEQF